MFLQSRHGRDESLGRVVAQALHPAKASSAGVLAHLWYTNGMAWPLQPNVQRLAAAIALSLVSIACSPSGSDGDATSQPATRPTTDRGQQVDASDVPDSFLPTPMNPTAGFSMRQFQWQNRVLLVFAPAADDRFRAQRAAVDDVIAQLADRDMVVIDVIGAGTGEVRVPETVEAEPRRLVAGDVKQLRRDFDVLVGDFTVLLVGKDGGEKRRETNVADLGDIFEQIDGMPMRRREMQQRDEDH